MCTVVKMTPGHCKLDWEFKDINYHFFLDYAQ